MNLRKKFSMLTNSFSIRRFFLQCVLCSLLVNLFIFLLTGYTIALIYPLIPLLLFLKACFFFSVGLEWVILSRNTTSNNYLGFIGLIAMIVSVSSLTTQLKDGLMLLKLWLILTSQEVTVGNLIMEI